MILALPLSKKALKRITILGAAMSVFFACFIFYPSEIQNQEMRAPVSENSKSDTQSSARSAEHSLPVLTENVMKKSYPALVGEKPMPQSPLVPSPLINGAAMIDSQKKFRDRLLELILRDLTSDLPELTKDEIERRTDVAITRARDFGILSQTEQVRFAYLYVAIAPDLESNPDFEWMRNLLKGPSPEKIKLDEIEMALAASQP